MKKYILIGLSIIAIVVLIFASLNNVVGFQTVQSSNQKEASDEAYQKELLFQTIVDITNNKEIQGIILKSQLSKEGFFNPDVKFPNFETPLITKNQLKQMYFIGLILSKFLNKLRIQSIIGKYQNNNQKMQKEISAVIEKDAILHKEVTQLSNSKCDCDNEKISFWNFPILCSILYALSQIADIPFRFFAGLAVWAFYHFLIGLVLIFSVIAYIALFIEWSLFYLGVILSCW